MTTYVFDSGPLIDLFRHYYQQRFPTLWENFYQMIEDNKITSTREVSRELSGYAGRKDDLKDWIKENKELFVTPNANELNVVREIFSIEHFQAIIRKQERLQGRPVADPFVIARAKCLGNGCVVTTEKQKPNSAKIPNICKHFKIDCIDLEKFMEHENWRF